MRYLRLKLLGAGIFALAFNLGEAKAADTTWQPHQYALAAATLAFHIADWGQTRHIAVEPENYYEKGLITRDVIGRNPDPQAVDLYMFGTGALFLATAHYMPTYRTAILAIWGSTRAHVVINNHQIGLRIGGSF